MVSGHSNKKHHEQIQGKIREFCRRKQDKAITISLNTVRLGTMYSANMTLGPIPGLSNGTVIAVGNVDKNMDFWNYSNLLSSFLLDNNEIRSTIVGTKLRRKFPTLWITLGYYNRKNKFRINSELANIFIQYGNLEGDSFTFHISELLLVKSNYKNLRYHTVIEKFEV